MEILEILANTKIRHWGTWILSLVVSMGRVLLPSGELSQPAVFLYTDTIGRNARSSRCNGMGNAAS